MFEAPGASEGIATSAGGDNLKTLEQEPREEDVEIIRNVKEIATSVPEDSVASRLQDKRSSAPPPKPPAKKKKKTQKVAAVEPSDEGDYVSEDLWYEATPKVLK